MRTYPDWFIGELAHEEDKERARNGSLTSRDKVDFTCHVHGVYNQQVSRHIRLTTGERLNGCPECGRENGMIRRENNRRLTYPDWFIDELAHEEDKERARNGKLSVESKVDFICSIHGVYNQQVDAHFSVRKGEKKAGCPSCRIAKRNKMYWSSKRPSYPQWFVDSLANEKDKQRARDGSLTSVEVLEFICPKHGVYTSLVSSVIKLSTGERKRWCPECGRLQKSVSLRESRDRKRLPYPQWFIDELVNEEDKQKAVIGKLTSADRVEFVCPFHGKYTQLVGAHIKLSTGERGQGCPVCRWGLVEKRYPQWFIEELVSADDKQRALTGELLTSDVVEFSCSVHGKYKQLVGNHIKLSTGEKHSGCPKCVYGTHRSKLEDRVLKLILGDSGERYELNRKGYLRPSNYEADIIFPDRRIIVEVNGSFHHQTYTAYSMQYDSVKQKNEIYHYDKFRLAKENGYHLINLFDVDWVKDRVERFIGSLLVKSRKVYARNCVVRMVSRECAASFCNTYHIQGSERISSIFYGLFLDNDLVSVMTFGRKRYSVEFGVFELLRYCVKEGIVVVGGALKLLKEFEENRPEDCKKLVTYSDNDFFTGDIYCRMGFGESGYIRSYYWNYKGEEITRSQAQLKHLRVRFPELYQQAQQIKGNKEDYILSTAGAFKVYRAGHTRWVKRYD